MTEIQSQILALNSYARNSPFLMDNWGTTDFKRTFKAALAACGDALRSNMGVRISWSDSFPTTLSVSSTSLVTERTTFQRELPLEGVVAQALLADMQDLAVLKARENILVERERALLTEASMRVMALMKRATTAPVQA